jgi:phospholipid/cholesterol/gamma-HCH transport system permease protein
LVEHFFGVIGKPFIAFFKLSEGFGSFFIFQFSLFGLLSKIRWKEVAKQVVNIGYNSIGIILLTAAFIGLVQAIQIYQGFHRFNIEQMMGYTIFYAIGKELGPVVTALMITSRAVSAMAAELGTMRVTEQIDAIDTLAIDSRKLLLIPRIIAALIAVPLLTLIFDVTSNIASFLMACGPLDVNPNAYLKTINQYAEWSNFAGGLVKAGAFGFEIAVIGCYFGYNAKGGARGVGEATTKAVVASSVGILAIDYLLTSLFISLGW